MSTFFNFLGWLTLMLGFIPVTLFYKGLSDQSWGGTDKFLFSLICFITALVCFSVGWTLMFL